MAATRRTRGAPSCLGRAGSCIPMRRTRTIRPRSRAGAHLKTHTKPESIGQAGRWQSPYHDSMIDHDKNVGQALDYLDELGLADNTFVMYSTDNGPHMNSRPDGAMTLFRSEKNTNWEGAFRVPMIVRWPSGRARSRTRSSSIMTGSRPSSPWPANRT
jgi:arylsulfatase A-like enzyme